MRIKIVFLLISLFAAQTVFAAESWLTFCANNQRTCSTDNIGPVRPELRWNFEGPDGDTSALVGADGTVYVKADDVLYALDNLGGEKWRFSDESARFLPPSIGPNGTIYLLSTGAKKTYLNAINPEDGKPEWRSEVEGRPVDFWISPMAISSKGEIYVITNRYLSKYDLQGKRLWSNKLPEMKRATTPSLSPDESVIYIYSRTNGGILAINTDGKLRWKYMENFYTDFCTTTVGPDGSIYVADSTSGSLIVFEPGKGSIKWRITQPDKDLNDTNVTLGKDGTIYINAANSVGKGGSIYSISNTGKINWEFKIEEGDAASPVTLDRDGRLYFASGKKIYCIDTSGRLVWEYKVEKKVYYSYPVIANGMLYILDWGDRLYAIGSSK
jgi:hypothetical protein